MRVGQVRHTASFDWDCVRVTVYGITDQVFENPPPSTGLQRAEGRAFKVQGRPRTQASWPCCVIFDPIPARRTPNLSFRTAQTTNTGWFIGSPAVGRTLTHKKASARNLITDGGEPCASITDQGTLFTEKVRQSISMMEFGGVVCQITVDRNKPTPERCQCHSWALLPKPGCGAKLHLWVLIGTDGPLPIENPSRPNQARWARQET